MFHNIPEETYGFGAWLFIGAVGVAPRWNKRSHSRHLGGEEEPDQPIAKTTTTTTFCVPVGSEEESHRGGVTGCLCDNTV